MHCLLKAKAEQSYIINLNVSLYPKSSQDLCPQCAFLIFSPPDIPCDVIQMGQEVTFSLPLIL